MAEIPKFIERDFDVDAVIRWLYEDDIEGAYRVKMKMIRNLRRISKADLNRSLRKVVGRQIIVPDNYAYVLDHETGKSKFWIYTQMCDLIKRPKVFVYPNAKEFKSNVDAVKRNKIDTFRIIDDCAYTGRQNENAAMNLLLVCAEAGIKNPKFVIQIPYMTNFAYRRFCDIESFQFAGLKPKVIIPEPVEWILSLKDLLTWQDIQVLGTIHENYTCDAYLNETLTYFEHAFPDIWSFEIHFHDAKKRGVDRPYRNNPEHLRIEYAVTKNL